MLCPGWHDPGWNWLPCELDTRSSPPPRSWLDGAPEPPADAPPDAAPEPAGAALPPAAAAAALAAYSSWAATCCVMRWPCGKRWPHIMQR